MGAVESQVLPGGVHRLTSEQVVSALDTQPDGLSSAEATARAARYGPNLLTVQRGVPAWRLLVDELRNPLVLVLLVAALALAVISLLETEAAHWGDAGLIAAIVLLNGALGFAQSYRAQRGIEALQRLAAPSVEVLRDRRPTTLPAEELVPGDVVLLREGDRVPADGRVLRVHDLHIDESSLSGESVPVAKTTVPADADASLAERSSMVYLGTTVAAGRGRLVVTHTGMATELGGIAQAVQSVRESPTPFQREVADLGRKIGAIVGALVLVIAALQLTVGGLGVLDTFVTAVALAVAAIPEGLPVVITLALALGTRRMLERRALVRSLPVVEILGSADVICTDKTGTLTEGRMSLRRLFWLEGVLEVTGGATENAGEFLLDGQPTDQRTNLALRAAGLCNDAELAADGTFHGDATEIALLVGALKAGVELNAYSRVAEIPFSAARKRMSVVVERDGERQVLVKGAPEVVLPRCSAVLTAAGREPMTDERREQIVVEHERLAGAGLRVLALAGRQAGPTTRHDAERELVFYGLAGLADPPRAEVRAALEAANRAGIQVVMVTGDNPLTAQTIGREIGLDGEPRTGADLEVMSDAEIVEPGQFFARVEPAHKLRILEAFRADGRVVVMTGDGVNDAPALKGADVGIAMGRRGTDVARDASDLVLVDDNFATIVAAIDEGRRIAANIKKFLNYLLTGNVAEVLVILGASLMGYLPVSAVQILWINLVTDSGPAVALAADPPSPGQMDQPPRRGQIIGRPMLALVAGVACVMAVIVLATFFIGLAMADFATARTLTFTALVVQEYLRLSVIRVHEGLPLWTNRWVVLAVFSSLAVHLLLLYTPLGQQLFGVVPLGLAEWAVIAGGVAVGFPLALLVTRAMRRWLGPI